MTGPDDLGSAAEEAVKLLSAAEQWARSHVDGFLGDLTDAEHLATGSPECQVCPVCQGIGALRKVKPETVAHLFEAGAALAAALRSVVTTEGQASTPTPGPQVQRINLDEL